MKVDGKRAVKTLTAMDLHTFLVRSHHVIEVRTCDFFFPYKSVKVHYDHFTITTLQREAGGNIEEIRLEAARALCKAAEARNRIFHKCQWQQSLKNT